MQVIRVAEFPREIDPSIETGRTLIEERIHFTARRSTDFESFGAKQRFKNLSF